jgi:hypothetical protein
LQHAEHPLQKMSVPKLQAQLRRKMLNLTLQEQHKLTSLPIAKTTVGSREWIEMFSFSMAVTGSKQMNNA